MRIAIWHNLPSGGGKRALYGHVKALLERGHYIEAWTTDDPDKDYLSLSRLVREHRKPLSSSINKSRRNVNSFSREKQIASLIKNHCRECIIEISEGNFDVILANSCSLTTVPPIALFTDTPAVLYLGEPDRRIFEAGIYGNTWSLPEYNFSVRSIIRYRKDFLRIWSQRFRVREQSASIKAFKIVLVNSLFSRESVKRAYGIDPVVCYLGVNDKVFRIIDGVVKKPFVAGMGRISPAKNPEAVISAIALIPSNKRPVVKWITNDPVYDCLERVKALAEKKMVEFIALKDITDEEVVRTLNEASVLICTSHLEPFGLAPLEANICGTSVIAIEEGGYRETIANGINGFLVQVNNPMEIAALADRFCSDKEYSTRMGFQAMEFTSKRWSYSQMADNIERELLKAIG